VDREGPCPRQRLGPGRGRAGQNRQTPDCRGPSNSHRRAPVSAQLIRRRRVLSSNPLDTCARYQQAVWPSGGASCKLVWMTGVTRILASIEQGDPRAAEELLPLVYDELRRLAVQKMAQEAPGQTLQATALVHEAYLTLVGLEQDSSPHWNSRGHFFAAAGEAMRRILIMNARRRAAEKRGGGRERIALDPTALPAPDRDERLLDLDEALSRLERRQPERAKLVKLRFFTGLTNAEAAAAMGISDTTADRYWAYARAWLRR